MKKITSLLCCLILASGLWAQENEPNGLSWTSIAIVGDAVGGWPSGAAGEVDVHQLTNTSGSQWTLEDLVVTTGSMKFRADNSWNVNWGAESTAVNMNLTGTAVYNSPVNFSIAPGTYDVLFDPSNNTYTFTAQATGFAQISLVGPAVGGWDTDLDMNTTDGESYSKMAVALQAGEVKWRQNHAWSQNWGASVFPSGTAVFNDPGSVYVEANTYNAHFNLATLAYAFDYVTISLVGDATPWNWPAGTPGEVDGGTMTTTDGVNYTMNSVTVTTGTAKFRQNYGWSGNWGAADFPSGTGVSDGPNIEVTAGTYSVHFNRTTGAYSFEAPLAVNDATRNNLKFYPNPTQDSWNIVSQQGTITSVTVSDLSGKRVMNLQPNASQVSIAASQLAPGLYLATVDGTNGKQVIKLVRK